MLGGDLDQALASAGIGVDGGRSLGVADVGGRGHDAKCGRIAAAAVASAASRPRRVSSAGAPCRGLPGTAEAVRLVPWRGTRMASRGCLTYADSAYRARTLRV